MIDKLNIPIKNKLTKKIHYQLYLDSGYWRKQEFDSIGNKTYDEDSRGYWFKAEYDTIGKRTYDENSSGYWVKYQYNNEGKRIYFENSGGYIIDDR